jgi:broad specificity phosphatase PhoE
LEGLVFLEDEKRMALVILIRHGQTDENVSGKISGQGPAPLNPRGQEQARLAAEVLAPLGVTHLLSSPVVRARQTAEVVAQRVVKPIEEVPSLHEVDYGDWEGSFFQTQRTHPAAHAVFHDPVKAVFPNGESLPNVQRRGVESVESARRRYPDGVIAAVSHGDVIRTTMAHYLNMPFNDYRRLHLDNGALSVLELHGDWVRVKAFNFVPQVGSEWLKSDYAAWQKVQQLIPTPNGASANGH